MKVRSLALSLVVGSLTTTAAIAQDAPETPSAAYVATVDPAAFPERLNEHKKTGVTVSPEAVRMITPGIDKHSIYKLIGPPLPDGNPLWSEAC